MPRQKVTETDNIDFLKRIAAGVKDMTLVSEMAEEKVVPTISPGYNRASGVGGQVLGCITLVHGPNQVGKSVFALMVAESLRRLGHVSMVFDAEFAGEKEWYSSITPRSGYKRTGDLNELERDIRGMIKELKEGKAAKRKEDRIPEDVGCAFVVDTITKLMPEEEIEKIREKGLGRSFPLQARFVSLWSKSVTPDLWRTNSTVVVVTQERAKLDAKQGQKQYDITGGRALRYDNRLCVRVDYASKVIEGGKENKTVVGMECHCTILNNKIVGTTDEKFSLFTSNGNGMAPKGIDLVREALAEADLRKALRRKDNHVEIRFGKERFLQVRGGWVDLRERLYGDEAKLAELVERLNEA